MVSSRPFGIGTNSYTRAAFVVTAKLFSFSRNCRQYTSTTNVIWYHYKRCEDTRSRFLRYLSSSLTRGKNGYNRTLFAEANTKWLWHANRCLAFRTTRDSKRRADSISEYRAHFLHFFFTVVYMQYKLFSSFVVRFPLTKTIFRGGGKQRAIPYIDCR